MKTLMKVSLIFALAFFAGLPLCAQNSNSAASVQKAQQKPKRHVKVFTCSFDDVKNIGTEINAYAQRNNLDAVVISTSMGMTDMLPQLRVVVSVIFEER